MAFPQPESPVTLPRLSQGSRRDEERLAGSLDAPSSLARYKITDAIMTVAGVPFALLAFPLAFFLASLPHFIAAVVRLRNGINEDEPGWVVLSSDTRRHSLDAPEGKSSDSGREGRGSASSASGKPVDGLSGTLGREGPLANLPLGTPSSETVRMRRGSNVNIPNANGGQAAKILSIEEHRLGHDRVGVPNNSVPFEPSCAVFINGIGWFPRPCF